MTEQIVEALHLVILIGASFQDTITWKREGELVPLPAGTTAEVKVRRAVAEDEVFVRFSTSPGPNDGLIVLTDPGLCQLILTEEQTLLLSPLEGGVFDIKYFFPTGEVIVKLDNGQGRCDIREIVTRP